MSVVDTTSAAREEVPRRLRSHLPLIIGLALSAAVFVAFVARHRYAVNSSDAHYYLAIADNLIREGRLANPCTEPATPVVTPQNGIVVVYSILRLPGLSYLHCLLAVSVLNYALWICGLYPFLRLVEYAGTRGYWQIGILSIGFLSAGPLLYTHLTANNDCINVVGSLWWTYFWYKTVLRKQAPTQQRPSRWGNVATWLILLLAPSFLIHFRVNILIYVLAAALAAFFLPGCRARQWRALTLGGGALVLALGSSLVVYLFLVDSSNIAQYSVGCFRDLGWNLANQLGILVLALTTADRAAGALSQLLGPAMTGAYAIAVITFLFYCLGASWRSRQSVVAFSALLVLGSLLFLMVLPRAVSLSAGGRYIVGAMPFLWLLAMSCVWTRPIGYLLVAAGVSASLFYISPMFPKVNRPGPVIEKLVEGSFRLPSDAVCVGDGHLQRFAYTLFGARHQTNLAKALRPGVKKVWVVGKAEYQASVLRELAGIRGWQVVTQRPLVEGDYIGSGRAVRCAVLEVGIAPIEDKGNP